MDDFYNSFTKGLNDFSEVEKDFIEIKLSGAKVTHDELEARFGEGGLQTLLLNSDIKRYLLDRKVADAKKIEESKDIKLNLLMSREDRLLGLETIREIARDKQHKDRVTAGKVLMKGDEAYAATKGKQLAESEGNQDEQKAFVLAYPMKSQDKDD